MRMALHDVRGLPPSPSSPEKQELRRQREEIESLTARLGRRDVECEALRTEKAVLVDELARANKKLKLASKDERPAGASESKSKEGEGPIRQLVDLNAALTAENARLQAVVDVTRKSFKAHIRGSRKRREEDRETIEALRRRREDELLRRRRGPSEGKDPRRSPSERTAKSCEARRRGPSEGKDLRRFSDSSSERKAPRAEGDPSKPRPKARESERGFRRSLSDNTMTPSERTAGTFRSSFTESADDSHRRVSEVSFGTSGDDWIDEGEEGEEAAEAHVKGPEAYRDAGRTKSEGSGVGKALKNKWTGRRHTVQEGDGARAVREADDLLVDFGEARRWSGVKW